MTLLINNDVQRRVLEMSDAIDVIEDAFEQLGRGDAAFEPRRIQIISPEAMDVPGEEDARTYFLWASLRGAIRDPPRFALRYRSDIQYIRGSGDSMTREKFNGEPGTFMGMVNLFDTTDGEMLAMLNDGVLQHARVGATAGIACKHLSREDAGVVGLLGSSWMARSYARAFDVVRDLERIDVFSPTPAHREAFADEMEAELGVEVRAVEGPDEAVRGADIVASCTDSMVPVLDTEWVEPGRFFVNCTHGEVPDDMPEEVDHAYITTNSPATTDVVGPEDILDYVRYGGGSQPDYPTLPELLTGDVPLPDADDESVLYFNRSNGMQFPAISNLIYEKAMEADLGTEIPGSWFQQDIRP